MVVRLVGIVEGLPLVVYGVLSTERNLEEVMELRNGRFAIVPFGGFDIFICM